MATARSPIKVPCENEDLPEKENAPDFDEDTLKGELCSTSASVITFFYFTSFKNVSRCGEQYMHFMTNLKDIWPVMTLLYDYIMLFIERIYDTEIFDICFSKNSKQVHKVIISKDFLWSSFNIHFVSNIINIIIIIFPLQCSSGFESFNSLFLLFKQQSFDHHPSQREGGRGEIEHCLTGIGDLNQKRQDFPLESMCYISSDVEVFKVDSALSLMNGSEEKSA